MPRSIPGSELDSLVALAAARGCRYHAPFAERAVDDRPVTWKRALEILARLKPALAGRFGVTRFYLFGSTARNTAGRDSDIDIVVAFDGPSTLLPALRRIR